MSTEDYRPRFSFEISEEQKKRADKILETYGLRKAIFGHVLDDILDMIEEYGGAAVGVLMSGKIKPRDIIPTMKKADKLGRKQ